MKTYRGVKVQLQAVNFGIRWRCLVSFTPLPLYPRGKKLLDRNLGGLQRSSGRGCEEKEISVHAGNRTLVVQLVAELL
jgi:hypothetical protein